MSCLCFISAHGALRLATSAPGNNYLARAHASPAGWGLARPGQGCVCHQPLPGNWTGPSPPGCLSWAHVSTAGGRGACPPERTPPEGEDPPRAQLPWGRLQEAGRGSRGKDERERRGRERETERGKGVSGGKERREWEGGGGRPRPSTAGQARQARQGAAWTPASGPGL